MFDVSSILLEYFFIDEVAQLAAGSWTCFRWHVWILSTIPGVIFFTHFRNRFTLSKHFWLQVANTSFEDDMGWKGFYCVQPPQVYFCVGLHRVFVKNLFGAKDYQTTSWRSSILVCHSLMIQRLFKVRCAVVGDLSTGRYVNQML